jgi:MoaA/NifB/PqqE/SkfB family radical SAM enzyme
MNAVARRLKHAAKRVLVASLPRGWLNVLVRRRFPRSVQFEVTTACNLDCPLCFTHVHARASRFLDADHFDRFLESARGRLSFVNFHIQGEPLLHPRLFEMVARCTRAGVRTGFATNGMLLDRHLAEVFESGLSHLTVAIDGCTREDYDLYRHGGDFDHVVSNTRQVVAEKQRRGSQSPTLRIQTIMFPYNEDKEPEILAFLRSFGADEIRLKQPSYCTGGEGVEPRAKSLAFLEVAGPDREQRKYARTATSAGGLYRDRRLCPQLERASVLSDGRIVACCMDSLGLTTFGDLKAETFDSAWQGRRHAEVLEKFFEHRLELCRHCSLS